MVVNAVIDERAKRLRTMKRVALGLLLAMFATYVVTGLHIQAHPLLPYIHAFAEAATVGALADWFAVTALFRHPLGLPIPHTAIIQRRKDDIGATLARFVGDNFLITDALKPRLAEIDFAAMIAGWVQKEDNARRLGGDLAGMLRKLVSIGENRGLRDAVKQSMGGALRQLKLAPVVAEILDMVLLRDPDQTVVNELLELARKQLESNRNSLQSSISERTPWWLPGFVDRQIVERLISEVESYLEETHQADDEQARQRLIESLEQMINALRNDEALIERGEALKETLLEHPVLQGYLSRLVHDLSGYLDRVLAEPDSGLRQGLDSAMYSLGQRLTDDNDLHREINDGCQAAVLHLVDQYHHSITNVITETVKRWDAEATAERIELQVGRDLQFIRINGTVVGGIVGLILHSFWLVLG